MHSFNPKSIFYFLLIFIVSICNTIAQQDPSFSQYNQAVPSFNPAFTGSSDDVSFTAIQRIQWPRITGPFTQHVNLHAPILHKSIGLGAMFMNDRIGFLKVVSIGALYSYKINFQSGVLSAGLQGGIRQYSMDLSFLDPKDVDDSHLQQDRKYFRPDVGAGILYQAEKLLLGASVAHLINYHIKPLRISEAQHYYIISSYNVNNLGYFNFIPSILVKKSFSAPVQIDFTAHARSPEAAIGITYRTNDIISFQLILFLGKLVPTLNEKILLGYAYDHSLSEISSLGNGANEFFIQYNFTINSSKNSIMNKPKSYSPAYF